MDDLLIKKARKGDKESFSKLIMDVKNQAYSIAYCYLHNKEDSMDAVCNAIEKAYRNIKKLKKGKYFKTWFIRIVINESKLELRHRKKIAALNEKIGHERGFTKDIEGDYSLKELFEELEEMDRTMIYMKYHMGYTLEEISDIMDMPLGTVKTRIYSNIKRIKESINVEEGVNINER